MSFDVARARAETKACATLCHFNNAGAALMPDCVVQAQIDHLQLEARHGGYEAKALVAQKIEGTYALVARLIGAKKQDIALVENATVAWQLAFNSFTFAAGDRILTAEAEYESNFIAYLKAARDHAVTVDVVPSDGNGSLDLQALENMIDERVKLIAISHVPTNGGLINPASGVGRIARAAGIPYLLDACQSVGQINLDVAQIGCDFLSATGRKYLRGPRGSGFLYASETMRERLEPPFIDLHGATWVDRDHYRLQPDARRYENWEFNYAAVLGLGVAVDYALGWGLPAIERRVTRLAERLRSRLASCPGITVRDIGRHRCGIVTFTQEGKDPEAIQADLARKKINVSTSGRSSTLLDMERRGLEKVVRASVHYYNTDEEIERLIEAL